MQFEEELPSLLEEGRLGGIRAATAEVRVVTYEKRPPGETKAPKADVRLFWELISVRSSLAVEEEAASVEDALSRLPPERIRSFQGALRKLIRQLDTDDVRAAAERLMTGWVSNASFDYFRAFVLSRGERLFERMREAPESVKRTEFRPNETFNGESLMYAAAKAYERATGEYFPD